MWVVWLLIGLLFGSLFVAVASAFDEWRVLAIGLVVAALIYVVIAAFGGASWWWLGVESLGIVLYGVLAVLGLRYARWWLALGCAAHPVWDVALHLYGGGSAFAPALYAVMCIGFDLVVAAYIAFRGRYGPDNSFKPNPLRGWV